MSRSPGGGDQRQIAAGAVLDLGGAALDANLGSARARQGAALESEQGVFSHADDRPGFEAQARAGSSAGANGATYREAVSHGRPPPRLAVSTFDHASGLHQRGDGGVAAGRQAVAPLAAASNTNTTRRNNGRPVTALSCDRCSAA